MRIDRALVAGHLCNLLPSRVRAKLLADDAFLANYGPLAHTIMTVGTFSIDQVKLLNAVRRSLATHTPQEINDVAGRQLLVNHDRDTVSLGVAVGGEVQRLAEFQDLMILSPNSNDRVQALHRLLDSFGPTAPDFSILKSAANERELTDLETTELLEELTNGFEAYRARIARAHNADRIILDDIVPDSLLYYERFCGPIPRDIVPEEYLTRILPSYRRQLLSRNLVRGLEICLLGSLRDDLAPSVWTEAIGDEEMWTVLNAIDLRCNPFALLGALDIALTRQHDQRFRIFGNETISTLVKEELSRPDDVNSYELLPLFAELVLDRINVIEGGAYCEPVWKRMCAWMHAGLLMQSTLHVEIKVDMFRKWAHSIRTMTGTYAQMIDLRRAPMYRAGEISHRSIREEIIGRLIILKARHQAAGRFVPHPEEIDEAVTRLERRGSPLGWMMPGPLDGHVRPSQHKRRSLSEVDINEVMDELSTNPSGPVWSKLAYFSQCLDLGDKILEGACEVSTRIGFDIKLFEGERKWTRLVDMCFVAAAHRNEDLARSISAMALQSAAYAVTEEASMSILHILFLASAAFESEEEWSTWIGDQLVSLAYSLPAGEPTESLREHLSEIKKVLPLKLAICSRAEAVTSAAN